MEPENCCRFHRPKKLWEAFFIHLWEDSLLLQLSNIISYLRVKSVPHSKKTTTSRNPLQSWTQKPNRIDFRLFICFSIYDDASNRRQANLHLSGKRSLDKSCTKKTGQKVQCKGWKETWLKNMSYVLPLYSTMNTTEPQKKWWGIFLNVYSKKKASVSPNPCDVIMLAPKRS